MLHVRAPLCGIAAQEIIAFTADGVLALPCEPFLVSCVSSLRSFELSGGFGLTRDPLRGRMLPARRGLFRRFGLRRVRGVEFAPFGFRRRRCGVEGLAFDGGPLAVVCRATLFTNRNFTLLGGALAPGAFPTAISMPPDSSNTVIPLPWPTYCTACPRDAAASSNVMGKEKFAGTECGVG
jgi:hypothetical protein